VCHTASIIDTEADLSVPAHQRIIKKADVVVCGSGTGLVAAVRAAMLGKKVILLEKSSRLGGNTDYAHAYFPIYTKWHEEAGMPDVREEAIQHYLEVTNHVLEPDVVRTAVYATGEFFDWLCTLTDCHKVYQLVNLGDADAHGPIYGPGLLDFPKRIVDNLNCRDDAIGPGWGGTFVKYTMLETIEKLGLDVEIYTEHAARHLLLDDSGKITGVLAEDPGGETQINAPVVILATGGFGKSDEKLREFTPWFFAGERPFHRFSVPGDTGDGIDMLRELGVEPNPERMFISQFGPKHHPFSNVLADIALEPEMLQVNLNGKRWVDETGNIFAMREIIHEQPQERSWAIHTRDTYEKIAQRFIKTPAFASKAYLYETWEEELLEEASLPIPPSFAADTL
jgi:fumarate reductase flavoprotein subunit